MAVVQAAVSFLSGWECPRRQWFGNVSSAPVKKKSVEVHQSKDPAGEDESVADWSLPCSLCLK